MLILSICNPNMFFFSSHLSLNFAKWPLFSLSAAEKDHQFACKGISSCRHAVLFSSFQWKISFIIWSAYLITIWIHLVFAFNHEFLLYVFFFFSMKETSKFVDFYPWEVVTHSNQISCSGSVYCTCRGVNRKLWMKGSIAPFLLPLHHLMYSSKWLL